MKTKIFYMFFYVLLTSLMFMTGCVSKKHTLLPGQGSGVTPSKRIQSYNSYYHFMLGRLFELKSKHKEALKEYRLARRYDRNSFEIIKKIISLSIRLGDVDAALKEASLNTGDNKENSKVRMLIGGFYVGQRMFEKAEEQLVKSIELDPYNFDAYVYLSITYTDSEKFSKAINTLNKLIEFDKESFIAHYYIAKNYIYLNEYEKAQRSLEKSLEINPSFTSGLDMLSKVYYHLEKNDLAIKTYEKLIDILPDRYDIRQRLGDALLQNDNLDEALTHFEMIGEDYSEYSEIQFRKGLIYYKKKEYKKSLVLFKDIRADGNNDQKVGAMIASIYEDMGKLKDAVSEWENILRSKTKKEIEIGLVLHIGELYEMLKQGKDIIRMLKIAISIEPKNPELYFFLSVAQLNERFYGDAVKSLKYALKLNPENEEYYFQLGVSLEKMKDYSGTLEAMESALRIDPNHKDAHNYIGYLLAEQGKRLPEAVDHIKKALENEPSNGYYRDSLGWAYYKMGKYDEALKELELAVSLIPADEVVFDHIGDTYFKMNNYKKALDNWKKAFLIKKSEKIEKKMKSLKENFKIEKR